MRYDKQGREYLNIKDVKHGQPIWLDGGFTCIDEGKTNAWIDKTDNSRFFYCNEGKHNLDGQYDDDGYCVGVYASDPSRTTDQGDCCMGIGDGSGSLFIYGDWASIKVAQRIIFDRNKAYTLLRECKSMVIDKTLRERITALLDATN